MRISIKYLLLVSSGVLVLLFGARPGLAQPPDAGQEEAIARLTATLSPLSSISARSTAEPAPVEGPRIARAEDGSVTSLGAPPGHHFPVRAPVAGSAPETARSFLNEHRKVFGVDNQAIDFRMTKVKPGAKRSHVRFQQTYSGIPVFAAELIVQLSDEDGVEAVHTGMARDFQSLDADTVSLVPRLSGPEAERKIKAILHDELGKIELTVSTPKLTVFIPAVLRASGPSRLVWEAEVSSPLALAEANIKVLLDAQTGEIVRRYPLIHSAMNRQISDANTTTADPGTLVRSEGGAASGITDADNAYRFLGDTYNFYSTTHGRDAIDGAGGAMNGTVRYCAPNPSPSTTPICPPPGLAFYNAPSKRMYFGVGYVTDDVTAHELTHGVTAVESGLTYENESGAINESFSDIWGEYVDLTNGSANDNAANRWLIGEEMPIGTIRDMEDPTVYMDPDRRNHASYVPPSASPNAGDDFGGVHRNSGVNNKLCFLLTDGGSFNGQTITGLGITRIARLYYEVQTNMLTASSGWSALYEALQQAAINLGWSRAERNNLYRGCVAVEIARPGLNQWVDKASTCPFEAGFQSCATAPFLNGPFKTIGNAQAGVWPGDILRVKAGTYTEHITLDKIMTIRAENGTVTIQ